MPTFSFEQSAWSKGYSMVIGVDEVGRGALAGPVVAGAAALRRIRNYELGIREILALGIDDSKRLTPIQRENLVPHIQRYFHCTVGEASVREINAYGIVVATRKAMRRAIRTILNHEFRIMNQGSEQWNNETIKQWRNHAITNNPQPITHNAFGFLLLDAFPLPHCPGFPLARQQAIIRGDRQSISIAAASIIAKVYRDRLMRRLAGKYASYGWEDNKGYGTSYHWEAIGRFGIVSLHRNWNTIINSCPPRPSY